MANFCSLCCVFASDIHRTHIIGPKNRSKSVNVFKQFFFLSVIRYAPYYSNTIVICPVLEYWDFECTDPRVVHTLSGANYIVSVTVLGEEMFVLRERDKDQVEVFEASDGFKPLRTISIPGLIGHDFNDISSCGLNGCLYISDWNGKAVRRQEVTGNRASMSCKWEVGEKPCGLSVTASGSVLVTFPEARKLKLFSSRGVVQREIAFDKRMASPWHAVQLSDGRFCVCHGEHKRAGRDGAGKGSGKLSLIDVSGRIVEQSRDGDQPDALPLNCPRHFAVDEDGSIFATDCVTQRVLLLDPKLISMRNIVSSQLHSPYRVHLDTKRRRLYVTNWLTVLLVIMQL